jgi:F0F1-type ATP synthase assembly protein I
MIKNLQNPEELQKKIALQRRKEKEPRRHTEQSGTQLAINMTAELIATTAVGGFMGYMLDEWINTSPLFFLCGVLLGSVAGLIAIKRINDAHMKNMEKNEELVQEILDK